MSQLSQHNDNGPNSQHFSQDSPTIGRNQIYYSPNNSLDIGKRSQRKAAPSPLQTITTATSPPSSATPTRTTFSRAGVDHNQTSSTSIPEPRSPKERLDDLLASEKSFYRSEESSVDSNPEERQPKYPRPLHDPNGASRSVSDPVLTSKSSGGSPTSTRPNMAATAPAHRAEMARAAPRTSSIDSAISSISAGHSSKPSHDMTQSGPPDIANLIHAAGSAEAVIQYLLKEKTSQATQNAQLWRLVDKQRAMILGLNKDLERALKDKERYKKKVKESMAQASNPSPVDSNMGPASESGSIVSETKPLEAGKQGNVEALVSTSLRDSPEEHAHSPIDVALAPYPITPPAAHIQASSLANLVEAEHKMPSPTEHAFQQYNPDGPAQGFEAGQQQRKANEIAKEVPYNALLKPSRTSPPSEPPRGPPPNVPPPRAPMSSQNPSFAVIEASPQPDEGLRAFPTPPRKAPPAPLKLGKQSQPSSHLRQASGTAGDTDSDYDDVLEVDELPVFERGRRKTREEDDRVREISAMKDAELRSLSKKSKASAKGTPKSKPTTPKEGSFPVGIMDPMPTSPRTIPISPPDAHMRLLSPSDPNAGSLAGMLSDAASAMSSPLLSPPLKSPGLPLSPRPIDRPLGSPLPRSFASPPLSPRMGGFPGAVPLSPRAPRQPIPLPPNTPMSISSPGLPHLQLVSPKPLIISKKAGEFGNASPDGSSPSQSSPSSTRNAIYKGLITEDYPDLLLPPNALPSIDVKVASSRLKPSRASIMFPKNIEEDPVFTLAVFARSNGRELWRVEKDSASLFNLDHTLKQSALFTAKTPEKSLFSGHAPARIDARRAALDKYLSEILDTQMDTNSALEICKYLSTNTMEPYAEDVSPSQVESGGDSPIKTGPGGRPLKNGYLTKRGKNFGGWKARYFVLDGPVFKYYESPGGPHLGAIKLQKAQIGKQSQANENHSPSRNGDVDDPDSQYRHAFLILEPKRKDSSSLVRHVLCAESDLERDQWVEALCQYIDYVGPEDDEHQHDRTGSGGSGHINGMNSKKKMYAQGRNQTLSDVSEDGLRGISYENTKPGSTPVVGRTKQSGTPSPPATGHERDNSVQMSQSKSLNNISAPKNAQIIQDSSTWGNRSNLAPAAEDRIKQKKRSFFGFGTKVRASTDSTDLGPSEASSLSQMAIEQHGPIRPAFGAPLAEAVRYNHPVDVDVELPAVVYRCIEYLDAKNAAGEEGIFRLSGSNVIIRQLRERFNNEGDVNLITDDQYYDIHAVASLLKLYLRELPTTILTRELHLEFLAVTELHDLNEKINALNGLVHRLPRANQTLLRYLAAFLINIINHADTNKMTVRNVGIVFSPTLNIPAPVFALFLQQYTGIFDEDPDDQSPTVEVHVSAPPLTPEDIRSPRRQMFQELPTPSYNQQSFDQVVQAPLSFPQPQSQQQYSQRSAYDTGFTPLQPSYEPQLQAFPPTMAGPEYGRSTPTLAGPAYEQFGGQAGNAAPRQFSSESSSAQKSKRRESSMFGMNIGNIGLGQRRPSNSALRPGGDPRLVDEETFFD